MKIVSPLIFLTIAGLIALTVVVLGLPQTAEYPVGTLILVSTIMFAGGAMAIGPIVFARGTENFLTGTRRTNWLVDESFHLQPAEYWSKQLDLPKNGWFGARCNSTSLISFEIMDEANFSKLNEKQPYVAEEYRQNARDPVIHYRARTAGHRVLVIRNDAVEPIVVGVKLSTWVAAWR